MAVYHTSTLDLLTYELDRHRRYLTDAKATIVRWQAEMPGMGHSINGMQKRVAELESIVADLESFMAIAVGANAAEAEYAAGVTTSLGAESGAGR